MIEMCLRAFTDIDDTLLPKIHPDGSCHTYVKQNHLRTIAHENASIEPVEGSCFVYSKSSDLHTNKAWWAMDQSLRLFTHDDTYVKENCQDAVLTDCFVDKDVKITTPIYPWQKAHLNDIILRFAQTVPSFESDKKILLYAADQKWAEINMLMQYHKISLGLGQSCEIFGGDSNQDNIKKWNPEYAHWTQMQRWEYREWLSLYYPRLVDEWITSPRLVPADFLIVSNKNILESTSATLAKIIEFCELTQTKSFEVFADEYQSKQQYILNEYSLIEQIIDSTINKKPLQWHPISIVGESILQNKFRQIGFEWYCDGLDIVPTSSEDLIKIIYSHRNG